MSQMSVESELLHIKSAYDPSSPECAFAFYFYNAVPAEQAALYVKPPTEERSAWDRAVANRPSPSCVPALATGFGDLEKRVKLQEMQVMQYRSRLHEINNKLTELASRHDLHTAVHIQQTQARHAALAQRAIALAGKVQVLKSRGYALRGDEEAMKRKFSDLLKQANDPAVFGRVNEIWARMTLLRDRAAQMEQERETEGVWRLGIDWEKDETQLELFAKVLSSTKEGTQKIIEVTAEDEKRLHETEQAYALEKERSRGHRRTF